MSFLFPIGTDRPQRRVPWVNIGLIALNVVIYFLTHEGRHGRDALGFAGLNAGAAKYMLFPVPAGDYGPALYQFITYQFLHADFWHLLGNMAFLYVFGNNLNEKLGHVGYLLFYLTGGIVAGCGQVLTSTAPTLGASGSISACAGLFLVLLPRTNVRVFFWLLFIVDVFEIPSMWFILFSVVKDIVESQLGWSSVAHGAHLTGNACGFAIGLLLIFTGLVQRDHYDLLALLDRWRRRKQYESMVAKGFDPFSPTDKVRIGATPAGPTVAPPVQDVRVGLLREEVMGLVRSRRLGDAAAKYLELRAADGAQVLPASEQLDIANQLMHEGRYEAAAGAYEDYLRVYETALQREQVQLILGLIYARYLPRPDRAVELLRAALVRLHDAGQREMAEGELARLGTKD